MGGWTVAVFLCLGVILPCSGINTIEEMIPEIRSRLDRMRGILLPVPEDMMSEAWYLLGSYIIPLDSETELCRNHSSILFDGYLDSEMWALKMVDASGKPGSGIMHGNIMDLGNYEECIEATAPNNLFRGQHCIVETRGILPPELMDASSPQTEALPEIRKDVMFSVCVPDSCTARDVMVHMNIALNSVNATAIMYNTSCSSAASPPLEPAEYLIILILLVMVLLIVLSTIYDNVTTKSEQKELLVSFSITSNTSQLLSTASPQNSLPCLHGLRVFAMAWIILGHRFMNSTLIPLSSFFSLLQNLDSKAWIPWQNINLTVEIFFLLSGTLAAYNFFRDRLKGKPFRYLSFFVHRYRRLTPPLLMVSLLYATVLPRLADGPIWRRMFTKYHEVCKETWWINLLYISNYVVPFKMCVPQTWYVEVDFQLHMLSPLLLLLIHKERTRALLLAGVVFLASNVALMVFAFLYEVPAGGSFQRNRSTEIAVILGYIYTHFRLTTFIVGLCLGYLLFKIKQEQLKVKLSKPQLWAGWALAALLFLGPLLTSPIFDDPQHVHRAWLDSLYVTWKRPAVGLATAWVILVCTVGRGGIVNTILSWKALIPLSRLTYCVFLVHMYLQFMQTFRTRTSLNLQTIDIWYSFFGDFVVSHLVAALLYLTVEAPFSNVFNCLFKEPDKSKEQSQNVVLPTLTNP